MRVTFRAQFSGPKTTFSFRNVPPVTVEVFRQGDKWKAREATSKNPFKFFDCATHGTMKDTVAENFEKQLSPWAMFDTDGKQLDPDHVEEDSKGNFEAKLITHVGRALNAQGTSGANYFYAACGIEVHVRQLRSTRGQAPPDCKACRKEWEKTKPEERLPK
jgi:hypothetical protein